MKKHFSQFLQGHLSRRDMLRFSGLGLLGASGSGWMPALAARLAADPRRQRHCILLWMNGGPSQTDTFDMKPGHPNGGEFEEIATSVPGLRISEHLPKLAKLADQLAVVRSLNTKEGDHQRATVLARTGHPPGGPIAYPTIGSALAKELGEDIAELPNYVSIAPSPIVESTGDGPGFLGPKHSAATVRAAGNTPPGDAAAAQGFANLRVDYLKRPTGVGAVQAQQRYGLWQSLQSDFLTARSAPSSRAHDTVYRQALRMMKSEAVSAFDLSEEPDEVREAYGRGQFGQGCLMARRLIERGVPFVEVSLGGFEAGTAGWDTHLANFPTVQSLSAQLDAGWSTLMTQLEERGLLDSTTILWMGEFGRTPQVNANAGRDHFPQAWTCVLAGGGVKGGQAYGRTSEDGMKVEEGQVGVGDILATLCAALGVDPETENISEIGRPIQIAEGKPIAEILA